MNVKLLTDFNPNDLIFKPVRKTSTGSRIIDVVEIKPFQTSWLKILYEVDYNICVDVKEDKLSEVLNIIDDMIIDHSSDVLDFPKEEIIKMYRPLKRSESFKVPLLTNTVLFDKHRNTYNKSSIKTVLKPGQYVRFIFSFKKIYFKDHELTFPLELQQIELA